MLGSPINTALTGLNAASTKMSVSAQNVANVYSTTQKMVGGGVISKPYQPQKVIQTSLATGGVLVSVQDKNIDPVKIYQPDHPEADTEGFVSYPNISLDNEIVEQIIAAHEFQANLLTVKKAQETQKTVLDILG